jgi:hypothetical protein
MNYVVDLILGIVSAMLIFMLQSTIRENRKLKKENTEANKKRQKALEDGVVCILRKHLMDEHDVWVGKGFITSKALESGILMYKAYKSLGGNGMIDHMEEEIQELPIRD